MRLFGKSSRAAKEAGTTLFFASDLHGSEVCFKKFVNAASFYKADVLVLGGDISGKIVIPIVDAGHGIYKARMHGRDTTVPTDAVEEFERRAGNGGLYTRRMSLEEYTYLSDHPEAVEELFSEVLVSTVRRWIDYARDRLAGSGVTIINAPGNDDPFVIDDVLREHGGDTFRFVDGEIVEIAPGHEMLSSSATNHTPWHTHREYSENEIAQRLARMTAELENPATALFNIHVPPYDSGLDTAPMLSDDLSVRTSAGGSVDGPGGVNCRPTGHRRRSALGQPARAHPRVRRLRTHRELPGHQLRIRVRRRVAPRRAGHRWWRPHPSSPVSHRVVHTTRRVHDRAVRDQAAPRR